MFPGALWIGTTQRIDFAFKWVCIGAGLGYTELTHFAPGFNVETMEYAREGKLKHHTVNVQKTMVVNIAWKPMFATQRGSWRPQDLEPSLWKMEENSTIIHPVFFHSKSPNPIIQMTMTPGISPLKHNLAGVYDALRVGWSTTLGSAVIKETSSEYIKW